MYTEWLLASSITVGLVFILQEKWLFLLRSKCISPSVIVGSPASPWTKQYNSRSWKGTQILLQ